MKRDRLKVVASREVLGLASSADLRGAGLDALEDGCDSPSLRVLAGLTDVELDQARPLFELALAELNVPKPSRRDALLYLAHETARQILNGTIAPYEGAKRIWDHTLRVPEEKLSKLDQFIYAAGEWEDRPEDRRIFEKAILVASEDLLGD